MQEKGSGGTGIWKWAEQGLTGSRQGNVWNLGVGWQRMEILPRVWKILGNWGITKELASSPTAGQRDSQKAPLPLTAPRSSSGCLPRSWICLVAWCELLLGTEVKVADNESCPTGHQLFYPPNATLLPGEHASGPGPLSVLIQSDLIKAVFFLAVTWVLASDL